MRTLFAFLVDVFIAVLVLAITVPEMKHIADQLKHESVASQSVALFWSAMVGAYLFVWMVKRFARRACHREAMQGEEGAKETHEYWFAISLGGVIGATLFPHPYSALLKVVVAFLLTCAIYHGYAICILWRLARKRSAKRSPMCAQ